jgi:hypothetical protein
MKKYYQNIFTDAEIQKVDECDIEWIMIICQTKKGYLHDICSAE